MSDKDLEVSLRAAFLETDALRETPTGKVDPSLIDSVSCQYDGKDPANRSCNVNVGPGGIDSNSYTVKVRADRCWKAELDDSDSSLSWYHLAGCAKRVPPPKPKPKPRFAKAAQAEQLITAYLTIHTSAKPKLVSCPTDVPAKQNAQFSCTAVTADGNSHSVRVRQTDDAGNVALAAGGGR